MFFHALGSCLNKRPRLIGQVFKHLPKGPASVHAMKETCVIVILAFLPYPNPIRSENAA